MKSPLKTLSLLLWVTQFGFSVLFPLCCFLFLALWLQERLALGAWVSVALGIVGLLTSIRTARICIRSLLKDANEAGDQQTPPISFNDHH